MCGIAGFLTRDPRPGAEAIGRRQADAIAHRGPDAEGVWTNVGSPDHGSDTPSKRGYVTLCHRRLSIIDLAAGAQPMGNEDGSVQIVFNGEIYNYLDLRKELLAKGHQFRTNSDTEVLVHLYEEAGPAMVERLRGMFAFALWDERTGRLVMARDHVGQKPLYIYRDGEKLVFGSEIKAILAYPGIDRSIDAEALEDYLAFGFIPSPRSIFKKIEKLPPAHVLVVTAENLGKPAQRYWTYEPNVDTSRSIVDWSEAIEAKLDETMRVHRIADVPIGAFLSGGLDSSVTVAIFAAQSNDPISTFSIGFREAGFSELPYAREVADRFGCKHVEETVSADAAADLDDLVKYYDEPFADSSAIPTMRLSRLARQFVKVAISGDGGDEAFGGYRRYLTDLREAKLRNRIPRWSQRAMLAPLAQAWPKADWLPRPLRAKSLLTNLSLPAGEAYANTLSVARRPWRRTLLADGVRAELNGHNSGQSIAAAFDTAPADDALAAMIAADIAVVLPDDFLTKVDRASMSCGLEVRPPLVDHELLDLTAQIPSEFKVRDGTGKWIFKEVYRERLPDSVCSRRKQGFEIPVDEWLRGPLRETFESAVLSPNSHVANLIDQQTVGQLYRSHLNRTGRHGAVLWSLMVLGRWADAYL
jgi:asparagine synthase (glutamine-hydrolysing)